jgi:hypothetical protein
VMPFMMMPIRRSAISFSTRRPREVRSPERQA